VIFHGDEVAPGAALPKGYSFSAETLRAKPESGGDERPFELSVRAKVHQMADQPVLKGMDEIDAFRQIRDWAKLTETGDRAELTFLPDDSICGRGSMRGGTPARERSARTSTSVSLQRCNNGPREADLIIVESSLVFCGTLPSNRMISAASCPNTRRSSSTRRTRWRTWPAIISDGRFRITGSRSWRGTRDQTLRLLHLGSPSLLRKTQRIRERSRGFF